MPHSSRSARSPALLLLLLMAGTAATTHSAAARSNDNARLALHLVTPTTKYACDRAAALPACSNTVTAGDLYPTLYYAYLLVQEGDPVAGIGGLQCGIRYDGTAHSGIDIFRWTNCATYEFPSDGWPAANGGNLITWDTTMRCQRFEPGGAGTGVVATVGYFYLAAYSADLLELLPRPIDGVAKVASCGGVESILEGEGIHHDPSYLGRAAFSPGATTPGYSPCTAPAPEPFDCTISGPDTVVTGTTGLLYQALAAPTGSNIAWSISGNATISGASTGKTVVITAGSVGSFALTVRVTYFGVTETCVQSVPVVPPECFISGPATVNQGTTGNLYTVSISGPLTSRAWSITGNGTITSGTTGASVLVTAGAPGGYELTCEVPNPDGPVVRCTYPVMVREVIPGCPITGPTRVLGLSLSVPYAAAGAPPGTTFHWSISGNGSINGTPTGSTVSVHAGPSGSFTLTLAATLDGVVRECSLTSTIDPGGGVGSNANAKLMIHLLSPSTTNECARTAARPACKEVVATGSLYPSVYYAYLLVQDASAIVGISGLQCGIDYNEAPHLGIDIYRWRLCADNESPSTGWPASGGGNVITWDAATHCQRIVPTGDDEHGGVVAVAGYFYLGAYTPDRLRLVPRPLDGRAMVFDCGSNETLIGGVGYPSSVPSHLGIAAFGQAGAYNPCGILSLVQSTTWSAIKGHYGDREAAKERGKP